MAWCGFGGRKDPQTEEQGNEQKASAVAESSVLHSYEVLMRRAPKPRHATEYSANARTSRNS
eukprot:ctg_3841.g808